MLTIFLPGSNCFQYYLIHNCQYQQWGQGSNNYGRHIISAGYIFSFNYKCKYIFSFKYKFGDIKYTQIWINFPKTEILKLVTST